uniref:Uncharacterized protein n=1 Tax=Arundo donax TaxID=35708 RepID=A0A0A9BS27_ARUDO
MTGDMHLILLLHETLPTGIDIFLVSRMLVLDRLYLGMNSADNSTSQGLR